jgi:hypothetical protein
MTARAGPAVSELGSRLRSAPSRGVRESGRMIGPMGNLIAKIRQWLGLEKKSDPPQHGSDAP